MNYQFKVGDKGKTRDRRAYEVVAVVPQLRKPVIAVVEGSEDALSYLADGRHTGTIVPEARDLRPPTQTRTIYVNVYPDDYATAYATAEVAQRLGGHDALAVAVPVTFEFTPESRGVGC